MLLPPAFLGVLPGPWGPGPALPWPWALEVLPPAPCPLPPGGARDLLRVHIDDLREIGHRNAEKLAAEVEALRARMGAG